MQRQVQGSRLGAVTQATNSNYNNYTSFMQASAAYKTCSPHERFIALIRTALLFPLYPQGHRGSG